VNLFAVVRIFFTAKSTTIFSDSNCRCVHLIKLIFNHFEFTKSTRTSSGNAVKNSSNVKRCSFDVCNLNCTHWRISLFSLLNTFLQRLQLVFPNQRIEELNQLLPRLTGNNQTTDLMEFICGINSLGLVLCYFE